MTLESLFHKYLADGLTAEELGLFRELSTRPENRVEMDRLLKQWLDEELKTVAPGEFDSEQLYYELTSARGIPVAREGEGEREALGSGEIAGSGEMRGYAGSGRTLRYWIPAAAAVMILATGAFLYRHDSRLPAVKMPQVVATKTSITPAGNKAVLTLANGTHIILDSAADGQLASQGSTNIIKQNGQIAYKTPGNSLGGSLAGVGGRAVGAEAPIQYNEIATPRGGFYQLILPDGTKVWLDAASSLKYPTAFTGASRKVELTGEAYFEVAANSRQPFMINTGEVTVQVLGTELNLMAYNDEDAIRTTLVTGALKVIQGNTQKIIQPGQQASWVKNSQTFQVSKPDMRGVLAWKQGEFRFEGLSIAAIMRQIERWYDVDVEFKGSQPTSEFNGVIPRKKSVEELLTVLEETEEVHFTIQGRKIIVTKI